MPVPTTLLTIDGQERHFDSQLGDLTTAGVIPCFRCGVCCQRWQPLITRQEAEAIAAHLGLPTEQFLSRYARPYPLQEDTHILRHNETGCAFLRYDGGLAACAIHQFKPLACRAWQAALGRKECREGLQRMARQRVLLYLSDLPLEDDSRQRITGALKH